MMDLHGRYSPMRIDHRRYEYVACGPPLTSFTISYSRTRSWRIAVNWQIQALESREIVAEAMGEILGMTRADDNPPRIRDIVLDQPYAVVEFDNGAQGLAFNYQNMLSPVTMDLAMRRDFAQYLLAISRDDPYLTETFLKAPSDSALCELAVAIAIISGLSEPFFTAESLAGHGIAIREGAFPLRDLVRVGDTVAVIGFGGYLYAAIEDSAADRILVSDLFSSEPVKKARIAQQIEAWQPFLRGKRLEIYGRMEGPDILRQADVAFITGSALCNGTLEELLHAATGSPGRCRVTVVQGHSVNIHPAALFRRGVDMVVQPIVDTDVIEAARMTPPDSGDFVRSIDDLLPRARTLMRA